MTEPLVLPVKIIQANDVIEGVGVLDCSFHPTEPWIFTSGMDKKVKLFM